MTPPPLDLKSYIQAKALNASAWQLAEMSTTQPPAPSPSEIITANIAAGHRLCYQGHDGRNTYWYFTNPATRATSNIFTVPSDDRAAWAICQPVYAEWRKNS